MSDKESWGYTMWFPGNSRNVFLALYSLYSYIINCHALMHLIVIRHLQSYIFYVTGSSESRRLYEEAMKNGSIESEITSVAMHGVAGTGKSSSMNLILGNQPEQDRKSTPLLARPATVHEIFSLFELDRA